MRTTEITGMTGPMSFWLLGVALPIAVASTAMWFLFGRPAVRRTFRPKRMVKSATSGASDRYLPTKAP